MLKRRDQYSQENADSYILCCSQHTDMPEEMRVETMELCVTACEKFATNNEVSVYCAVSFWWAHGSMVRDVYFAVILSL